MKYSLVDTEWVLYSQKKGMWSLLSEDSFEKHLEKLNRCGGPLKYGYDGLPKEIIHQIFYRSRRK